MTSSASTAEQGPRAKLTVVPAAWVVRVGELLAEPPQVASEKTASSPKDFWARGRRRS
jgi:hypothetical protein